jgi:hypothetical protein
MCLIWYVYIPSCNITLKDFGWLDVFFLGLLKHNSRPDPPPDKAVDTPPSQAHWQRERASRSFTCTPLGLNPGPWFRSFLQEKKKYHDICPLDLTPLFLYTRDDDNSFLFVSSIHFCICHCIFLNVSYYAFWHFEIHVRDSRHGKRIQGWKLQRYLFCCCPLQNVL